MTRAYVLAVTSHKGGTGRTTAALALAWSLGRLGTAVTLVDADPAGSASLTARDGTGHCPWSNVRVADRIPDDGIAVVDCPSVLSASSSAILRRTHGVLLCCLADPLSLRTLPTATAAVTAAASGNPELELLGILVGLYDGSDPVQAELARRLRRFGGGPKLPPIPLQPTLRDWPLRPGSPPPVGPARDAFDEAARLLAGHLRGG